MYVLRVKKKKKKKKNTVMENRCTLSKKPDATDIFLVRSALVVFCCIINYTCRSPVRKI